MTTEQINEIKANLSQFTGTEYYYHHFLGNLMYTDGVKYLAEACGAYWLIDIVASFAFDKRVKNEDFQVYKLTVQKDHTALVEVSDGNDKILAKQAIEFTDFPLDSITLWLTNGIILLPSEY